ncbi:MAG: peptidase, partial [Lachnospiraceae bacterium]|nr:peptidase [Lachnospiraceae bacterium]
RSFEAAEKMADGRANKLIVPSDLTNLAGTLSAAKEMLSPDTPAVTKGITTTAAPVPEKTET